ncbi:C40 family peptidase [Sinosporangium siamense]|uniref:NlpC/P60 domain-containing protein n=1 Tax=Sinosporangium siamense TaxID=1367973 RepID=A0A919R9U0_9ACTN|nr:C40 family peptidase [Sinosporangium siamense]GII89798.1 hypothetical protein Ssi02_00290 [Sinosporangium siamense]
MTAVMMLVLPVSGMLAGVAHGQAAGGGVAAEPSAQVVAFAYAQLGKPYRWGGTGPSAFDCSGLTMRAHQAAGVAIPRVTYLQWRAGSRVHAGEEQPGDLVFFRWQPRGPSHVGIVVGNGEMINAPRPGAVVRVASYMRRKDIVGFMRFAWGGEPPAAPAPVSAPAPAPAPAPEPAPSPRPAVHDRPAGEGRSRSRPPERPRDYGWPRYPDWAGPRGDSWDREIATAYKEFDAWGRKEGLSFPRWD